MGSPTIFGGRFIMILCYHITAINSIPPSYLSLKQCVIRRSVEKRNIIKVWFHVIINPHPLISDKVNIFCPIGGVENPESIGSPGENGGAVEYWIYGGGGTI